MFGLGLGDPATQFLRKKRVIRILQKEINKDINYRHNSKNGNNLKSSQGTDLNCGTSMWQILV